MQISRSYIDAFTRQLDGLTEHARRTLADDLAGVTDFDDMVGIMKVRMPAYSTMAEALAVEFYAGIRASANVPSEFTPEMPDYFDEERITRDTLAIAAEAAGTGASYAERLGDLAQREINNSANETIRRNTRRDPAKPKCASVPTSSNPCEWCRMRAAAGFIYDQDSDSHSNCKCRLVPGYKGSTSVEGYDSNKYKAEYEKAAEAYHNGDISDELKKKIDKAKARHQAEYDKDDGKVTKKWDDTNAILMVMRRN